MNENTARVMVDPEIEELASEELPAAAEARGEAGADLDAESLFSAELGNAVLLSRSEEEALARRIVRARARIRLMLRGVRRLSRLALAHAGRGVVRPERDFREREALSILRYAEHALRSAAGVRATGMDRARLTQFVRQLRAALDDYRQLRDEMVRANIRLVAMLARRYHHPTLTFLDLFQEGTFGLLRAVEKYEPTRGVKFSTYASWWIWQQLGRTADTQGSLIRTPVHWNQLRRRVGRAQPGADGDELTSAAELAEAEGIESERFAAMTQSFHFISTDAQVDDDDRPLEAVLPGLSLDPEAQVLQTALSRRLESAVDGLPERERLIVRQRFGIGGDVSQTLEELSSVLGVSRERVRQLETRALARLRKVCLEQGLNEYLN